MRPKTYDTNAQSDVIDCLMRLKMQTIDLMFWHYFLDLQSHLALDSHSQSGVS